MTTAQLLFAMDNTARFSPCRNWRYTLHRRWNDGRCVAFLLFNPSTADETQDDPTIRRCVGFGRRWGYGRLVILNLFAIRGTDPRIVERVQDPVGPMNDYWILKELADGCRELICAWGCGQHMRNAAVAERPATLLASIQDAVPDMEISHLGMRQDGQPRHPLMLPYATERKRFEATTWAK